MQLRLSLSLCCEVNEDNKYLIYICLVLHFVGQLILHHFQTLGHESHCDNLAQKFGPFLEL